MSNCYNCGVDFDDDEQPIEVAFYDTSTDPTLARALYWVKVQYHLGMTYECVIAQVALITRATWGQEPTVTSIQVIADDEQGEAMIDDLVDNEGAEDFVVFLYCIFAEPVRGI